MKTVHLVLGHSASKLLYFDQETQAMRPELVFVGFDGSTYFEINEVGLKGDALDAARKLVVVWGDSVVFSAGRGWPCLLDDLAPGYQFLNGGIEGDPYSNVLRRAREFNQRTAVHLNLLMLGWHPLPDNRNVRSALIAFIQNTPNTVLLTMPTALNRRIVDRDLSSYITRRDADNAFTFCGNLPYSEEAQHIGFDYIIERNKIVREVAAQMNIRLVDLFAEFDTGKLEDFRRDFTDMIHLRASAHPKIAGAVYEGIKDLLQSALPLSIAPSGSDRRKTGTGAPVAVTPPLPRWRFRASAATAGATRNRARDK
jgi:lysophospholipase L1-like esterase